MKISELNNRRNQKHKNRDNLETMRLNMEGWIMLK